MILSKNGAILFKGYVKWLCYRLLFSFTFLAGDVAGYKGRNNSNNFDLNRNFPDQFVNITDPRQPETIAVMNWLKSNPFVLSANLHGGVLILANLVFAKLWFLTHLVLSESRPVLLDFHSFSKY